MWTPRIIDPDHFGFGALPGETGEQTHAPQA
jgi:hypothetical protein